MASKRYSLLAGIFSLLAVYGSAQETTTTTTTVSGTGGYDVSDSSVIPSRRMPQHSEFLNGTYNFPAKPRNQWEIGIKGGLSTVSGDVPSRIQFSRDNGAFGVHVRKAFGYVFSARLEYIRGRAQGLSWLKSENYAKNIAWSNKYAAPRITPSGPGGTLQYTNSNGSTGPTQQINYNYMTKVQDLSLQGLVTLNNIRFHKAKTGFNVYGFAGIGAFTYNTSVNALNGAAPYNFNTINPGGHDDRKEIRDQLDNLMDNSYETPAENQGERRPKLFGNTLKPSGTVGAGIAFKLSNRFNIALEERFTLVKDDLLDGQRWQEHARGDAVLTRDFDSYNLLSLGINANLGAKSTEPLWWMNPLDYAYSEIRNPKLMRLPKPVLPDADGDGVTDQFDQEQTPAGCPVDTHGVSLDTDGDGVPDCRDKEKVTPTNCQPVDADGIGKCPCPEGCDSLLRGGRGMDSECAQLMGALPSISFSGNSIRLSSDAQAMLASVAARIRNNPNCRVVVSGYAEPSKASQQRSWDRVNAVINYMIEREGVSADRFYFNHNQQGGDVNTVDLRAAGAGDENLQNTQTAPYPNLRRN